ncbi:MAG: hypothetical protein HY958_10465 [Bacteroidia bacterium]|nr:hypothetical protein [Bacteroidia bacterium]
MKDSYTNTLSEIDGQVETMFNPFPGLRPFGIEESHLFFGRDGQSDEVLYCLAKNRFVAILGTSGGGKSSLIYCGLLPILHGGFITRAGSAWQVIIARPGNRPINNLALALTKKTKEDIEEEDYFNQSLIDSILRSSSLGLIDAVKQLYQTNKNILIFIDQFEELFRYRNESQLADSINETYSYIKLLVEAINQEDIPIYIAITMRSDFISECSQYQELSFLINKSHYLIPQMTRDDLCEAITGPIAVAGGAISTHLVHQLLNDIGDNPDQLPILQHALMRTWDYWIKHRVADEAIDINHYHAIGGIEKALSEHANEAFNELSPKGKEICVSLFKTLTEKGSDNRGIRRPTSVKDLALISHATEEEVMVVIEKFRIAGRSFLSPPSKFHLNSDTIIDLSHESLMRIWDKLKLWVEEEATSVQMYLRLSESAALYQLGKTGLWRPPDLQLAVNWRLKQQPTLAWAQRYASSFERTLSYLDASEKEYQAEEQNKIRLQKRALKRSRIFALVLGAAAVLSLGFMLYSQMMRVEADKQKIMAMKQTRAAEWQKLLAEREKEKAFTEELYAKQKSVEAGISETQAKQAKENAIIQKQKAIESANEANLQKLLADSSARVAYLEKLKADVNALTAKRAQYKAFELSMRAIAQSMAVKSVQVDKDKTEKALVAYQAYLFNKKYKGLQFNSDIYNGLFSALKAFKGKFFNQMSGHSASVRAIVFSLGNNIFYSAGNDGRIIQWYMKDSTVHKTVFKNKSFNTCLAISKNGKWLACGTDSLVQVFDIGNLENGPVRVFKGHLDNVCALVFAPDCNNLISASEDKSIMIWNLGTGERKIFTKRSSGVKSLAVTPDGKTIIGGTGDGEIIFWNRYSKDSLKVFSDPNVSINVITVSPDGSMLATADNVGNIRLWNVSFRKPIINLSGHSTKISDLKFSPDNNYFASASFDGTIRIWNTDNFNFQPYVLKDERSWIWTIAFSTDNNNILAGLKNNKIVRWPLNIQNIADQVAAMIDRNMSHDEWVSYVGKDVPYEKTCPDKPMGKGVTSQNIYAQATTQTVSESDITFKVQFASSKKQMSTDARNFNGLVGVEEIKEGEYYRYVVGNEKTLEDAFKLQRLVQTYGFKEPFCVRVKGGKILPGLN